MPQDGSAAGQTNKLPAGGGQNPAWWNQAGGGAPPPSPVAGSGGGDLTEELLKTDVWSDGMVAAAGIPIVDSQFITVGGGRGSFVPVDYLRIAGVGTDRMKILSDIDHPWQTYEYLTRVSQIPRPEGIRSAPPSRPDNIWGFPSYALSEAIKTKSLASLKQVLVEPIWADYYTPRAGMVFEGLERESKRISYFDMLVKGQVRMIRRRRDGGYFTILVRGGSRMTRRPRDGGYFTIWTPPEAKPAKRVAFRSQFVHVAVGY